MCQRTGALVVPKRKRPTRPCSTALVDPNTKDVPPRQRGENLGGPKGKEARAPTRRGPQWSASKGVPRAPAHGALENTNTKEAGAPMRRSSIVPNGKRAPRTCDWGLNDPQAKEARTPLRRGPRWSQSEGGPRVHGAGSSMIQTPRRSSRQRD